MKSRTQLVLTSVMFALCSSLAMGENAAERGFRVLTRKPMLGSDFNQSTFDQVWKSWPKDLRDRASTADSEERRKMIFDRYGLTLEPVEQSKKPLQYVVSDNGDWTLNCFGCHGGTVYGKPVPGAPNNLFALQTLTEEIRATKFRVGAALSRMDIGSLLIPLGSTHGTTNAVVFGIGLMNRRDPQLNLISAAPQRFDHHDMDAPPWWYFYKRPNLYIDGFAEKGHRGLMQFTLIPENGPEFFKSHEDDFKDVFAYISSLRPPAYTSSIKATLAERGKSLFQDHCAECHGTYGEAWTYPNRRIPLDEIQTDPVRLHALPRSGRSKYAASWFAHAGEEAEQVTEVNPDGYVAPPLDGIWASAPYFHNGSVPTLWHVLNPQARPKVWRRKALQLDEVKVGLQIESVREVPVDLRDPASKRSYFDTTVRGKSNEGHDYPEVLDQAEKSAVLEYLKTL